MVYWIGTRNGGLGVPDLYHTTTTTEEVPVGTRIRATDRDGTLGDGEFIFLKASVAVTAGQAVVYNPYADTVALLDTDTHTATGRPVAFALVDLDIDDYGWFQIAGVTKAKVLAAFAANAAVYATATGGSVDDAALNSAQILNAVSETAIDTPATGFAYIHIMYPFQQGRTNA